MQPSTSGTRGKDHWSKAATLIKKEIQDLHLDPFRLLSKILFMLSLLVRFSLTAIKPF